MQMDRKATPGKASTLRSLLPAFCRFVVESIFGEHGALDGMEETGNVGETAG